MRKLPFAIVFLGCCLCACHPEFDFGNIDFEPQIVVEGWIEDGSVATVCLTQSMTLDMDAPDVSLSEVPIRWAKVTVSDGQREEVLTGRLDANYSPPFVYRGVRMRGEAGKRYTLKVEYSGRMVTAETVIPPSVPIDRLSVSRCEDSDTLYQIRIAFEDNPEERNFYKVFTQVLPTETRYYSAFMGAVSDEVFNENHADMSVNRGLRYRESGKYTPYFSPKDTVLVKLTQLPEEGFHFWSDYENEVVNGKNPLFPSNVNLRSNIEGGKGIWCGYGKDVRMVVINDSIDSLCD